MTTRQKPFGAGGPLVYVLALVVVVAHPRPGRCTARSAASAATSSSPATRPACPTPGCSPTTRGVVTNEAFWRYALNSTVIALITTVVTVLAGVMAAYPLARYQFRGREPLFMVFVLGLLFPAAVAIIPLFILVTRDLQLGNTWWGVALPQAAFALPMTVVILRPFLMALPRELEEAALIDGASRVGDLLAARAAAVDAGAGDGRGAGVRRRRGTPTCCRCCCCRTTCVRCRWASPTTPPSTRPTPPVCSPSRRSR